MENVENIIFDLGGVLYDIDVRLTEKAFYALGLAGFDEIYSLKKQESFIDQLEKGLITKQQFIDEINTRSGISVEPDLIINAWNALLIGMEVDTLKMLLKLKKKYNTYLLSNTNEMHLEAISRYLQSHHGQVSLNPFFHETYYSCRMGLRKPDKEIYQQILTINNLNPEHTVFIDDNKFNVEAAASLGIMALHKPMEVEILGFLKQHSLL